MTKWSIALLAALVLTPMAGCSSGDVGPPTSRLEFRIAPAAPGSRPGARPISHADYQLMLTVGHGIRLPLARLARHSWDLDIGGREPRPSVSRLESSAENLCDRGFLAVLTSGDVEAEEQRFQHSDVPELREGYYHAGDVDFTPVGYRLYRELIHDVFGAEHTEHNDSGFVFDEASRRFLVLAPTRDLCAQRIEEIKGCPGEYSGSESPCGIAGHSEPEPIGQWRPNRFIHPTILAADALDTAGNG